MDMNSLIRVVETHADGLAERWVQRLRKEPDLDHYLREPEGELREHVRAAYEEIGVYLDQPDHEVIAEHFRDTGRRRCRQGVPLREAVRAVQLARSVLWQYVLEQGIFDSTSNLYQALNLFRQVVAFFDRAVLYTVDGYGEKD
jgi:hypothetical protein